MDIAGNAYSYVSIPKRVSEALNPIGTEPMSQAEYVSIPKRVSEALNLGQYFGVISKQCVSIPKRVSEALNHRRSQGRLF